MLSTTALLGPVLEASNGSARRADAGNIPRIVPVRAGVPATGDGWIGLVDRQASLLKGVNRIPLFAGLLGLALLMMALAAMWAREGR